MPRHTTEKARLERTDCGSFWRDFCAPHSQPFAQTQKGRDWEESTSETTRAILQHWASVPATCLLLLGWAVKWRGWEETWGSQDLWGPGEMDSSLLCFGASLWLSRSNKCLRGPRHLTGLHTWVPTLWGFLWQQFPSFLTFAPPAPAPTSRSLLSKTRIGHHIP